MGNEVNTQYVKRPSNSFTGGKLSRAPYTKECLIKYYDGAKWQERFVRNSIPVEVTKVIKELAFKDFDKNHGTIKRKDAIMALQRIYDAKDCVTPEKFNSQEKEKVVLSDAERAELSAVKDLFELYMDKDSDGGEDITQKEQFAIMKTIGDWYGYLKSLW